MFLKMEKVLLNKLVSHDIRGAVEHMIYPRRDFVGGKTEYNFDWEQDAIDVENLVIRIHKYLETMMDFDEYTDTVNSFISEYEAENGYLFDYDMYNILAEKNSELEKYADGYTYNDADYCHLNRDIHYTVFKNHDTCEYYILMMVHHGADARVGFGELVCFKIADVDYFSRGMEIDAYESESDYDISIWELEDVATFIKSENEWVHNETGNYIGLYSSSEGF
jgi:hypothetical protein